MYKSFYFKGKEVEEEFRKIAGGHYSSRQQDVHEHWDVESHFGKVDVKGLKSLKRNLPLQDDYIWIELANVSGKNGWLFGKADFFAFQTFKSFLVCPKIKLQHLVTENLKDEQCTPPVFCKYQRKGRKDLLTLVPTNQIRMISYEIFIPSEEVD